MKSVFNLSFSALFSIVAVGAVAQAGPSTSGGGMAVVCREQDGKIRQATLLDLYEAQVTHHLKLVKPTGQVTEDYFLASANTYRLQGEPNLGELRRADITENLHRFFDMAEMTQAGVKLPRLHDEGKVPFIPQGCQVEQLAIFHDAVPNKVQIDTEIWNAMDSLNRAALVTHEALYHWERQMHERTSEETRHFVAYVYADGGVTPVKAGVPSNASKCRSLDPRFFDETDVGDGQINYSATRISAFEVFPMMTPEGQGVRLQFSFLAGRPVIAKTTLEIPNISFDLAWLPGQAGIVQEPNKDVRMEIPLRGSYRKDWSVEVQYKTGEPMKLVVKRSGQVMTEEFVSGCN